MGIWERIAADGTTAPSGGGFWQNLPRRIDPMNRKLEPIDGYEAHAVVDASGREVWILKDPARGEYLSLTPHEYTFFQTLQSDRTLADVCKIMIDEKKILPFFILPSVMMKVYSKRFIKSANIFVRQTIERALHGRTWRARLGRVFHNTVDVKGLDRTFRFLYDRFFRWLFHPAALVLLHVVAVLGVAGFMVHLFGGRYEFLRFPQGFAIELPLLLVAQALIILGHELGHAFTVKHAGREVNRGGVMLALLLPVAFFVDTNDMWLERRRSRKVAVSWAGPLVNLLAVAACVALLRFFDDPDSLLSSVLYKTALISLLLAFLNLNPLLATDGYYMLMDTLNIPNLNVRGTEFVRRQLWAKLRSREAFNAEERILTAYGVLVFVWGAIGTAVSGLFLWSFVRFLFRIWGEGGLLLRSLLVALAAIVILPTCYALLSIVDRVVQRVLAHLQSQGYFRDQRKFLSLLSGAWAVLLVVPVALHGAWDEPAPVGFLLFCAVYAIVAGALGIWVLQRILRHRFHSLVFVLLMSFLGFLALGEFVRVLLSGLGARSAVVWTEAGGHLLLGSIVAVAGRWYLADHRDRFVDSTERLVDSLAPAAAALLAVPLVILTRGQPVAIGSSYVVAGVLWALGLAGFATTRSHHEEGKFDTAFRVLLLALCAGLLALFVAAAGQPGWSAFTLALTAFLLLGSLLLFDLDLAQIRFERESAPDTLLLPERERLKIAFASFFDRSLQAVRDYFGERKVQSIVRRMNDWFVGRAYGIVILQGKVFDRIPDDVPLGELGRVYGEAFGVLMDRVVQEAGTGFADRLIESLYDSLYWSEREVVTTYLFRGKRWDRSQSVVRGETETPVEFLRKVPLFFEFDDAQLQLLLDACQVQDYRPGDVIIREGEVGRHMYVIRWGYLEVLVTNHRVNTLSEHDYFGEVALVEDKLRTATVVARSATQCYVIGREEFDKLVRPALGQGIEFLSTIQKVGALRQFDFLESLSTMSLALLLHQSEQRHVAAGERILRQGDVGHEFFIILDGIVRIVLETPDGQREVARRQRGEYFGEIALLMAIPRTASVYAESDCDLLVIDKANFDRYFKEAQNVVQFSTRRQAVLERIERPA